MLTILVNVHSYVCMCLFVHFQRCRAAPIPEVKWFNSTFCITVRHHSKTCYKKQVIDAFFI